MNHTAVVVILLHTEICYLTAVVLKLPATCDKMFKSLVGAHGDFSTSALCVHVSMNV